ncbi:hypothetical protein WA158_002728 [Blastocystis sp. Blastoise]
MISHSSIYSSKDTLNVVKNKPRNIYHYFDHYPIKPKNSSFPIRPTLIIVIKTKKITEKTLELSILNSIHIDRQQIFIIQTNSPNESQYFPYESTICSNISFPYCIYTNYDQTDNFSFFLSIFYPSDYVLYIDEDQLTLDIKEKLTNEWLTNAINSIETNDINLFSCSLTVNYFFHRNYIQMNACLLMKQALIRKILSYTSINKNIISIIDYIPYFFQIENKTMFYDSFIISKTYHPMTYPSLLPQVFKCTYNNDNKSDNSLTLLLPIYKRITSINILNLLEKQTKKPDIIIILQNLHYIEFPKEAFLNRTMPTYYIWCSNWNSKYHMKTFLASLFTTTFAMTTDDDYYIDDYNAINNTLSLLNKKESMYGVWGGMNLRDINDQHFSNVKRDHNLVDHAAYIVFFRPRMSKINMRYNQATYYAGEDIGLGAINYLECNTTSYITNFRSHNHSDDEFRSIIQNDDTMIVNSYKNITNPNNTKFLVNMSYNKIYNYYLTIGFKSYFYRISNETVTSTHNARLPIEF